MTRTNRADVFSCQVADSNSDLRHLFRNPSAARSGGASQPLPIRYLKSLAFNHLQARPYLTRVEAAIVVRLADTDRTPSQVVVREAIERGNKRHFMATHDYVSSAEFQEAA
jgi:hypothetical protein